jgi:hypothetical protein
MGGSVQGTATHWSLLRHRTLVARPLIDCLKKMQAGSSRSISDVGEWTSPTPATFPWDKVWRITPILKELKSQGFKG